MKILILGGGGMLGHKMYQTLSEKYPDTYVTFRKSKSYYSEHKFFDLARAIGDIDVTDKALLISTLEKVKPDVIVNCIGLTTRKINPEVNELCVQLNALLPHQLAHWCTHNNSKLFHFSTDCVFSGKDGGYTEESVTDAMDLYGKSKALGEVGGKGILTIRSSIIGREIENKTELLEWFVSQEGKQVKGFGKVMYSGVTTNYMSQLVLQLLEENISIDGVFQVGSEPISKFDLLSMFNKLMNLNIKIDKDDSYISNKTLITDKFYSKTGLPKPKWAEMLFDVSLEKELYQIRGVA